MIQYVIYGNPTDHPGRFVVRRWHIDGKPPIGFRSEPTLMADCPTLEQARKAVQTEAPGHVCLQRCEHDDPSIVEVWV